MEIGVELSLYPLREQHLAPIRALIERLNAQQGIRVVTNSMSTQLFGEYELVMQTLARELRSALAAQQRAVVVVKIVGPLGD